MHLNCLFNTIPIQDYYIALNNSSAYSTPYRPKYGYEQKKQSATANKTRTIELARPRYIFGISVCPSTFFVQNMSV